MGYLPPPIPKIILRPTYSDGVCAKRKNVFSAVAGSRRQNGKVGNVKYGVRSTERMQIKLDRGG